MTHPINTTLNTKRSIVLLLGGLLGVGCAEHERDYEPAPPPYREAVVDGPVVEGPGVEVIETEPAPVERVYDEGYPPGTYLYGGYYFYGGYRYRRDVFVNRYVVVNVREHRYINVAENRRLGGRIEVHHRAEFARYHGARPGGPAVRRGVRTGVRPGPHDRE